MAGYAVIDFETTGLFPARGDRVIELAVVHVDPDGVITGRWESLVNPGRDLGPQHIHGISAAEILGAPTFSDLAPRLLDLLADRVLVAHNASFDIRFLLAELGRCGNQLEIEKELCTMRLAAEFLPGAGRTLADCCAAYDIELTGAHRALVDAEATAQLLAAYIQTAPGWPGWAQFRAIAASSGYAQTHATPWYPRESGAQRGGFLERITVKLPEFSGPEEQLDYLALLDRCLLDRHISAHEAEELVAFAEETGISRGTCEQLHLHYFRDLTAIAWADGELSSAEVEDLGAVAALLGISADVVSAAHRPPAQLPASGEVSGDIDAVSVLEASSGARTVGGFVLSPGDLIVLTGDMTKSRDIWHEELIARGYMPWSAVTKKVKIVVAADPDSLSGKARKARDYGIPVVGESWLVDVLAG